MLLASLLQLPELQSLGCQADTQYCMHTDCLMFLPVCVFVASPFSSYSFGGSSYSILLVMDEGGIPFLLYYLSK